MNNILIALLSYNKSCFYYFVTSTKYKYVNKQYTLKSAVIYNLYICLDAMDIIIGMNDIQITRCVISIKIKHRLEI